MRELLFGTWHSALGTWHFITPASFTARDPIDRRSLSSEHTPPGAHDLLGDGSLGLRLKPELRAAAETWIYPLPGPTEAPLRAMVELGEGGLPAVPAGAGIMRGPRVSGWVDGDAAVLAGSDVGGTLDLGALRARIGVRAGAEDTEAGKAEVNEALVFTAALLLGRQHRALVHGAAVIAPGGGAWLLAGKTHSGKTTTCANLIRSGLDYLSDDQVVVDAELRALGWPRRFTLDHGYDAGTSLGVRSPADPARFGPGRRRARAPLAGLIFPRIEAEQATRVEPASAADALASLVGHSPWLMADPPSAPPLLALLTRMARLPAYRLRLGRDTLADRERLLELLAPIFSSGAPAGWCSTS